jgi:hypothetical protein
MGISRNLLLVGNEFQSSQFSDDFDSWKRMKSCCQGEEME